MKSNLLLLLVCISTLFFSSCREESLVGEDIKGSWYIDWVNYFNADPVNPQLLGSLCNPGNKVELNVVGDAETRFNGNRSGYNNHTTIRIGDQAANDNTLLHQTHYIGCEDIGVTSIEHKLIYITGQDGYIRKTVENGKCMLESYRERSRPYYTVFLKLSGSKTKTVNGETVSDNENRYGQITYNCDDNKLITVNRMTQKEFNEAKKFLPKN